jgi:hypothetical protein
MTSSPGSMPPAYEAVLRRNDQVTGPIRLPEKEVEHFLEQFHRTYRSLGISIVSCSPGSTDVEPIQN